MYIMERNPKKIRFWMKSYSRVNGQERNLARFIDEVTEISDLYKSISDPTDVDKLTYMKAADNFVNIYNIGITKCNVSTNQKLPVVDKFRLTPCDIEYVQDYDDLMEVFKQPFDIMDYNKIDEVNLKTRLPKPDNVAVAITPVIATQIPYHGRMDLPIASVEEAPDGTLMVGMKSRRRKFRRRKSRKRNTKKYK